jgi:hypothetical protein
MEVIRVNDSQQQSNVKITPNIVESLINGEFTRYFQATYDDRFEWGLFHSSSGKFGI